MPALAHEVWEDPASHSFEFGLPHPTKDASRLEHEPKARLLHIIFAASYNAAMSAYYEWQGWGDYKPYDGPDTVYTADQLEEQRLLRPALYS